MYRPSGFYHEDGIQEMEIDFYLTADKYRDAIAWWSWARQGKPFAFANSASNTGATTLASAASPSDLDLEVVSASSFASSDEILIRSVVTDNVFELVKISAISSTTVTITAGLKYAYAAGAIFRHKDYWNACIMLDADFSPQQNAAGFYTHRIKFTEDL